MKKVRKFMNYAATHLDAIITYCKNDMVLVCYSDASYLSEPKTRSHMGGHHFMSSDSPIPPNNGAVPNIVQLIKAVMPTAIKTEIVALYTNSREPEP